jgi:hypothetical protein
VSKSIPYWNANVIFSTGINKVKLSEATPLNQLNPTASDRAGLTAPSGEAALARDGRAFSKTL